MEPVHVIESVLITTALITDSLTNAELIALDDFAQLRQGRGFDKAWPEAYAKVESLFGAGAEKTIHAETCKALSYITLSRLQK